MGNNLESDDCDFFFLKKLIKMLFFQNLSLSYFMLLMVKIKYANTSFGKRLLCKT